MPTFGALTQAVGFGTTSLTGPTVTGSDTYGLFFVASDTAATAATWNGVAMTLLQTGAGGFGGTDWSLFGIANPGSGSTVAVTGGTGLGNSLVAWYYTDVGGVRNSNSASGTGTTATITNTTESGDEVAGVIYDLTQDITVTVGTARGTQQTDANGGRTRAADNTAAGTSTALTATLGGSTPWIVTAATLTGLVAGPTIDTQPEADVVLINGDPTRASASFTVAATTSGGSLVYDWQIESGVGTDSYATVTSGSGATWAGVTTTNLTGTFTAATLSGRRVRCAVTDDNGTTTTNAVTLTVYVGPVLSKSSGTTNGSGVDTLTITSDYPNADGEFTTVTATAGGVTKQVSLHYEP